MTGIATGPLRLRPPARHDGAMPRSIESYQQNYDSIEKARRYVRKYEREPAKRLTMAAERRILRRWLRPLAGGDALDVPCGAGRLTGVLLDAGLRVTEADVSPAMVRACAGHFGPRCRYTVASGAALPFPDRSFDAVVCVRLLHHVPEAETRCRIMGELCRVARRILIVTASDADLFHNRWRTFWRRLRGREPRPMAARREIEALAAAAGFVPKRVRALAPILSGHRFFAFARDEAKGEGRP